MVDLTVETVLEHYKVKLGKKFNKYSYEAFLAARAVVRNYDPAKGPFEGLAHVALNTFLWKAFSALPNKKLFDVRPAFDYVPNTDATHLKLDIIKHFGEENYNIFQLHIGEKVPVILISKRYGITVDAVQWRLSRIHKYIKDNYINVGDAHG